MEKNKKMSLTQSKWKFKVPHAVTILFIIIIVVTILTYIVPAGTYERTVVDGRSRVVPGSYHTVAPSPVSLLDMFRAIPLGFKSAVEIIFTVLAGGIMFNVMQKTNAVENAVGSLVNRLGLKRKYMIVIISTMLFGLLGVAVGYENNIAIVPIAVVLSLAIGGDLVLAAGISVGAMTVGFGLSPINPYTVGTGHKIAELPMFSGAVFRSVLCFIALSYVAYFNVRYLKKITKNPSKSLSKGLDATGMTLSKPLDEYKMSTQSWLIVSTFALGVGLILYGVFVHHWYLIELSSIFLIISLLCGLIGRLDANTLSETVLQGIAKTSSGAFMVGYATTIKVLMEMGGIGDTISHAVSQAIEGLPLYASAISMSVSQSMINMFIPSGSGQALATLPVMIPIGELIGLTRQTTILAFQIGDGVTNLFNPTLGGLIAMLSMCRVPLDRWIRFIFPVVIGVMLLSWVALVIAVQIGYA